MPVEVEDIKNKIRESVTEAIGLASIWLKRIRFWYDILSIVAFVTAGIYFYFTLKEKYKAEIEIRSLHQKEKESIAEIAILKKVQMKIEYRIQTNMLASETARREINEAETSYRSSSNNWRSLLGSYTNGN